MEFEVFAGRQKDMKNIDDFYQKCNDLLYLISEIEIPI